MIPSILYKPLAAVRNTVFRTFGVKTVGARALVLKNDEILLVKHTYQNGWFTIGGMVDRGESPQNAVVRELMEEAGVIALNKPALFGIYHNRHNRRDDYVALYIVRDFEMAKSSNSPEIAEKKWFSLKNLPPDITPSTLRRIEEYLDQREKSDQW